MEETSEAIWRIPKRMVSWRPYELDVSKTEAELADDALLEGARRRDYGKSVSKKKKNVWWYSVRREFQAVLGVGGGGVSLSVHG